MIVYSFIGVVKYLSESGLLNDLEEISCSSAGAIIGFFYVFTKGDVGKIFDLSLEIPLDKIAKPDIKSLLTKYGIIDTDRFEKYMIKVTGGLNPTFKELYEMNPIKLYIPTYDLVMDKTIYMSVDTTPDMKVVHAVRRSISVPIVMTPASFRYIDGSVKEYSPFVPFLGKSDVVEIRYRYDFPLVSVRRPQTFFQYLYRVVSMFVSNRIEYIEFPRIDVYTGPEFELFNFSMSLDEKLRLYTDGYYQAKRWSERSRACCHSNHDSSEAGPRSPASTHLQCTRDPELQSEGPRRLEACATGETTDPFESSSPVPLETDRSDPGTCESSSHLDEDS